MIISIPFRGHSRETPLEQTITISFENEIQKTAIKRIEKETGISFAYSNHKDLAKKVMPNVIAFRRINNFKVNFFLQTAQPVSSAFNKKGGSSLNLLSTIFFYFYFFPLLWRG
ncbi:MAG: hypothetical protein JW798_15860 [Prolixibacteraceae bacterium]|nr:hypothetical protein [Prolixibacteraceae bacterium]